MKCWTHGCSVIWMKLEKRPGTACWNITKKAIMTAWAAKRRLRPWKKQKYLLLSCPLDGEDYGNGLSYKAETGNNSH